MNSVFKITVVVIITANLHPQVQCHRKWRSIEQFQNFGCEKEIEQISDLWDNIIALRDSVKNNTVDVNVCLNKHPVPKFQSKALSHFKELGDKKERSDNLITTFNRIINKSSFSDSDIAKLEYLQFSSSLHTDIYESMHTKTDIFKKNSYLVQQTFETGRNIVEGWKQLAQVLLLELRHSVNSCVPVVHRVLGINLHNSSFFPSKMDLMEENFNKVWLVFQKFRKNRESQNQEDDAVIYENEGILGKCLPTMIGKTDQILKYCTKLLTEVEEVSELVGDWRTRIVGLDRSLRENKKTLDTIISQNVEAQKKLLINDYQKLVGGGNKKKAMQRLEAMIREEL